MLAHSRPPLASFRESPLESEHWVKRKDRQTDRQTDRLSPSLCNRAKRTDADEAKKIPVTDALDETARALHTYSILRRARPDAKQKKRRQTKAAG